MRLVLLALVLAPSAAFAQFEVSSIADPIRPDRAPLALTEEVPAIFHLGMGDPASIFVNPARAARAEHRFLYGTIRPSDAFAEPTSLAGLFGTRERRWLVTAETSVFTREDTDEETQHQSYSDFGGPITEVDNTRTFASSNTASSTRARVLLVGRTDFGGYAFGLYGGYRTQRDEVTLSDRFALESANQSGDRAFSETQMQTRNDQRLNDRDDVGIGAEMAFAGRTWDLAAAISYQRRNADAALDDRSENDQRRAETITGGDRIVQTFQASNDNAQFINGSPAAVAFEVIGALRAGASRDDYLFGSVSGTFGSGSADYGLDFATVSSSRYEVNGAVISETMQSNAFADRDEADLSTSATRASLGYVYARKPDRRGWNTGQGMTILAAINPSGGFERTEAVVTEGGTFVARRETDLTTLALELPLFVRFGVTERLDAFGGGTYTYTYAHAETVTQPLFSDTAPQDGPTVEITREQTTDTFASGSRLYAGAVFTFRSGLTAQASLRGNLAEVARWTVSLGYRF